ncbi:unnamed protein product [Toxocara canis]|uniref:TLDc domain-containing protein n=1 Tax=Toxocara canis TaxID=6265 RepID=A0A3P7GTP8_TOXCA|nr:unnamed protein product [Toxocara canis]
MRYWTLLYSSFEQGISVTRFEANVFDYRGPTVAIFQLKDGAVLVLAVDQEWRNSGSTFGSSNSVFMQLMPEFKRVQKSSSIYCNFKLRNFPMKLTFDRHMTIDKEMSQVIAVEVFGCSGAETLQEQQKQKEWQRRQIEKNKKVTQKFCCSNIFDLIIHIRIDVPLPGKWDDNPDKFLLELGGAYSTADRREVPLPGKWDDNPDKFLLELGGVHSTADRREVFSRDD